MAVPPESRTAHSDVPFENCTLAKALADRMRSSSEDLTRRWLDRINARVRLDPNRIFPTDALLDHVPLLILGIADYIENPERVILAEVPVVTKAMELGELRFAQGFDEYEVLKEYEIFGGILFSFLSRIVEGTIRMEYLISDLLAYARVTSLARHFERVADNLDGFLPVVFKEAGFVKYIEDRRYALGSIASFRATKPQFAGD